MNTVVSSQQYRRMHKFNQLPRGFQVGVDGIPAYMRCECGKRWYADSQRPTGYCPVRRNA